MTKKYVSTLIQNLSNKKHFNEPKENKKA